MWRIRLDSILTQTLYEGKPRDLVAKSYSESALKQDYFCLSRPANLHQGGGVNFSGLTADEERPSGMVRLAAMGEGLWLCSLPSFHALSHTAVSCCWQEDPVSRLFPPVSVSVSLLTLLLSRSVSPSVCAGALAYMNAFEHVNANASKNSMNRDRVDKLWFACKLFFFSSFFLLPEFF